MKLTFDPDLKYQEQAIRSITDLFEGQPLEESVVNFKLQEKGKLFHNMERETR